MRGMFGFLRCLGRAVLAKGPANLPYGIGFAWEVAVDAWERWQRLPADNSPQVLREELQAAAGADPAAFEQQMQQVVAELAPEQPPEVQRKVAAYLTLVPPRIRSTFSRREDRRGLSVPGNWQPREARDLLPLLPPGLPRFEGGGASARC